MSQDWDLPLEEFPPDQNVRILITGNPSTSWKATRKVYAEKLRYVVAWKVEPNEYPYMLFSMGFDPGELADKTGRVVYELELVK